ncbi:beta-phosphoglucomutase [Soehngenia saccharolytica]|nr:beta-phosphoglucomutase [Soehngenia saccharolytica]
MIKFSGTVFDLDGVITETSNAHYEAWKELANELGFDLPNDVLDKIRGIPRMEALEIVLSYNDNGILLDESNKKNLAERKNEIYLDKIKNYSRRDLNDGVIELLNLLKKNNKKIALASSSKNAEFLLKALEIYEYFDAVVDPTSVKKGKPDPEIFIRACELIELEPNECIGIEDSQAGIESIKSAGMIPIGIGKHLKCEIKFDNILEFYQYLLEFQTHEDD